MINMKYKVTYKITMDNMNNEHQALKEAVNSILEKNEDELIELIEVTEL